MKLWIAFILALSFLTTGCGSKDKKSAKGKSIKAKPVLAEGQLPDHDFQIHQPSDTEIMIMIDSRGRAKEIPDEWSVDVTAHKPYVSSKRVVAKKRYKKKNRRPASVKKYKKKKNKKRKKRKKRKTR